MKFQSLKTALTEFLKIYSSDDELLKTVYLSWANDSVSEYSTYKVYDIRVMPLDIKNYQAVLPEGFYEEIQVLYTKQTECPTTRLEAIEWTQQIFGTDCKYVIKKECKGCSASTACECGSAPVIIVPDHLWQMNQSRNLYNTTGYVREFSMANTRYAKPRTQPLAILPLSTNNFHKINYDNLHDCKMPNLSTRDEYVINQDKIITSFKDGSIILAYQSEVLDEDGYRLIPDHPYAYEATTSYIMERKAFSDYSKNPNQTTRAFWSDMVSIRDKNVSRANSFFKVPTENEFDAIIKNVWSKVVPNHSHRYNLNRYKPDEYHKSKNFRV